jgi:hypothetical protein
MRTYGKDNNEAGYTKVNPLYLLKPIGSITDVLEENI